MQPQPRVGGHRWPQGRHQGPTIIPRPSRLAPCHRRELSHERSRFAAQVRIRCPALRARHCARLAAGLAQHLGDDRPGGARRRGHRGGPRRPSLRRRTVGVRLAARAARAGGRGCGRGCRRGGGAADRVRAGRCGGVARRGGAGRTHQVASRRGAMDRAALQGRARAHRHAGAGSLVGRNQVGHRAHTDPGRDGGRVELQPLCPKPRGRAGPDAGHDAHPRPQVRSPRRRAHRLRPRDQPARGRAGAQGVHRPRGQRLRRLAALRGCSEPAFRRRLCGQGAGRTREPEEDCRRRRGAAYGAHRAGAAPSSRGQQAADADTAERKASSAVADATSVSVARADATGL
jgi:hypothetical protein